MKVIDLLEGLNYTLVQGSLDGDVEDIVFDSRKANNTNLFIAMKGANVDSHHFIPQVIEQGCKVIVVEEDVDVTKDVTLIKVEASRQALAYMSAALFHHPAREMCVIGITGTKGKTTTAHMISAILEAAGKRVGVIGTSGIEYAGKVEKTNNTTPESYELQQTFRKMVDAGVKYLVMECSSQGFKMHRTDGIVFDYGLFTNIEPDHIGPHEHKDFNEYKYYKSRIFAQSKQGLINMDADYADELKDGAACPMTTFAIDRDATYRASNMHYVREADFVGVEFNVTGQCHLDVKLALPGKYNVYNALCAIALCDMLGIDENAILEALKKVAVAGRMEIAFSNKDMTVIVDYAHNALAMESLLDTLRQYQPHRLVVVFGCDGNRSKERRYGMGEVAAKKADFSILTADNSRFEKTTDIIQDIKSTLVPLGGQYMEIDDRLEAIEYALSHHEKGDMIAIIGKGNEDYNDVNGVKTHFSDREAVDEAVKKYHLENS